MRVLAAKLADDRMYIYPEDVSIYPIGTRPENHPRIRQESNGKWYGNGAIVTCQRLPKWWPSGVDYFYGHYVEGKLL